MAFISFILMRRDVISVEIIYCSEAEHHYTEGRNV